MPESAPSSPATASREAVCSSAAPASVPSLSRAEVRELLFDLPWPELQALAHQCRLRHKGRHVHVRGLLEFSNVCRRNCRYCGLRHENRRLSRYSLSAAELLRAASQAVAAGVDTLVLQSGEMARNPLWLAQVVRGLKERFGLPVTLSVGEQPREWYALWREAGADRFLLKHETADARLYAALHPGYRLTDRLRALSWLAELGYEVGSGFMVGVPGQRPESLVDDILLVRDMRVAMCGAGPFVPQADTPLGRQPRGSTELCLRVMAVLRPVKLVITNYPEGQSETMEVENNPLKPEDGTHTVTFSRELYVEGDDFLETPVPKYKRLYPGGPECRLKGAYLITCTGCKKDEAGNVTEIYATYDPDSRGGDPADGRKVKGATLHWVDAATAVDAEVRIYSNLFTEANPDECEGGFLNCINPNSLEVLTGCKVEASLKGVQAPADFQFLRQGYFCVDSKDSTPEHMVFNRAVELKGAKF